MRRTLGQIVSRGQGLAFASHASTYLLALGRQYLDLLSLQERALVKDVSILWQTGNVEGCRLCAKSYCDVCWHVSPEGIAASCGKRESEIEQRFFEHSRCAQAKKPFTFRSPFGGRVCVGERACPREVAGS